ncbi:hypothetical protein MMC21_003783 [Puttea exsequens]|nr:hypothetical protein [Puttea exsequens]
MHGEYGIRALDEDGNNLVLNSSVTLPSPSKLKKRAPTAIDCSQTYLGVNYYTSATSCNRVNPQAYFCRATSIGKRGNAPQSRAFPGTCAPTEICIDGIAVAGIPGVHAFCLGIEGLVKVVTTLNKYVGSRRRIPQQYKGPKTANNAVEVVFTGNAVTDGVTLNSIDFQAQAAQYNPQTNSPFTTLSENTCTTCSSLGIEPIPDGTSWWVVNADWPAVDGSSTAFFASL